MRAFLLALLLAPFLLGSRGPVATSLYLWQISHPATPGEADYLIGTIHVAVPTDHTLPGVARGALALSDCFVMEMDVQAMTPELVARWNRHQGPAHAERLPADVWRDIQVEAMRRGLPLHQLPHWAPWYLCARLTDPADAHRSRDALLRADAERLGLPLLFLEGPDDQLQMLGSLPHDYYDVQLSDLAGARGRLVELITLYEGGDEGRLEAYTFDPAAVARYPTVFRRLYDERNARWLPVIEAVMRERRATIAVGVGHLLGPGGILAALRARGYRTERLLPASDGPPTIRRLR